MIGSLDLLMGQVRDGDVGAQQTILVRLLNKEPKHPPSTWKL